MVIVFFKMHQEILPCVFCTDPSWSTSSVGGEYEKEAALRIVVPTQTSSNSLSINYHLYIYHEHLECSVKDLHFVVNVLYAENAPTTTVHYLTLVVGLQKMGSSMHNLSS
jgi:hypothetical protein